MTMITNSYGFLWAGYTNMANPGLSYSLQPSASNRRCGYVRFEGFPSDSATTLLPRTMFSGHLKVLLMFDIYVHIILASITQKRRNEHG